MAIQQDQLNELIEQSVELNKQTRIMRNQHNEVIDKINETNFMLECCVLGLSMLCAYTMFSLFRHSLRGRM